MKSINFYIVPVYDTISIPTCVHDLFKLIFLVLCAMIQYLPNRLILLSSLSLLIDMTHQYFACMLCMILAMISPVCLV
jgi:hypothetical protein